MIEPGRDDIPRNQSLNISVGGESILFDYGRVYIVLEKRMERTLLMAQDFVYSGSEVLCISRLHPDLLREKFSEKGDDPVWLSERSGSNNIPPNQLSRIVQRISVFLSGRKNAVVILDGIDYLGAFNEFDRLNVFVEQINDLMMASGAILLMPIDPLSLDARSLARLRRFAEVLS